MDWLLGLIGGLVGGNLAGLGKNALSLGVGGNSVAGAVGGGLTGALIEALSSGGLDFGQVIAQVGGGGAVGAVLTTLVGMLTKGRATAQPR
ncbi:hypothetical protein [Nocardia stercoris]|uniref:Uncharacterized protein n=1 Tax=Nocardia stercoris TaxID=2483361 RepID=A0A3M2KVW5_9NOCA|nr:hypothetical protein [Nocardia stercoris]RMI28590.1 hypothetical protein EBN03_29725 [Nocardia stercoris]